MEELHYHRDHWSNDFNPDSALAKAAELGTSPFNQTKWNMFTSLLPPSMEGLTVLDYGCGVGGLSLHCAKRGAKVTGVDRSEAAILAARYAAERAGLAVACRFRVTTTLTGGPYDLILAKDVIEHIEDDGGWLDDLCSALKPQGMFIFCTHNNRSLNYIVEGGYHRWWRGNKTWMGWDPTHVRFYNSSTLTALLERHHFRVLRWASVWIVPYNIISWLTLLRCDVTLPSLKYVDRGLGKIPPFNRLGWGLMAVCQRTGWRKRPE